MRKFWRAGILALVLGAQGCALVLVGGAAAGAVWVGSDPRTAEVIQRDFELRSQIDERIVDVFKERAHVNVNVYNGIVLLTGEVPGEAGRRQIEEIAGQQKLQPAHVHNETVIAATSSLADRANDGQITTRVRGQILADARSAPHVLVVTERRVVYLMGMIGKDVADRAARSASVVPGVKQVVKLVEPLAPSAKK